MAPNKGFRAQLPNGIKIGQRFLLRFDDPRVEAAAYQGRLQDMSKSGLLCFDAPDGLRPPRGTPVTVCSVGERSSTGGGSCAFSSEIRGRGRLRGRVPVLLVEPPEHVEARARRSAHRISVCLRGGIAWRETPRTEVQRVSAVITNLSGGGAQVYTRQPIDSDYLELSLDAPTAFIEEIARRTMPRKGTTRRLSLASNPFVDACDRTRERLLGMRARVVATRVHSRDERGPVYAVSLAFCEPQETCFQLVRYLERQAARKGIDDTKLPAPDNKPQLAAA